MVPKRQAPGPLVRDGAALLSGFALPIGIFLVPYLLTGAVADWLDGVLLRPGTRFESASSSPAAPWTVLTGVAAVALAAGTSRLDGHRRRRAALAVGAAVALGFALDDLTGGAVLGGFWYALRTWIPALVVWGAWELGRRREPLDTIAYAALATAGLWALVQFPYPAPAYVFYVAPLGVVATLAVVGGRTRHPPTPALGVLAALFAFLGAGYAAGVATSVDTALTLDRGGIVVSETDARTYEELAGEIRSRAGEGGLWAGPDAPEVYFLSGMTNRTPVLYEFLSGSTDAPAALTDPEVTVVVLNERPLFSRSLSPETTERLASLFPESRRIGDWVVRWRSR